MKMIYIENKTDYKLSAIKFILIQDTLYWGSCNYHKEIADLIEDDFSLENLQGAGTINDDGYISSWESIGYNIHTPYEKQDEIQNLFWNLKKEDEEIFSRIWAKGYFNKKRK